MFNFYKKRRATSGGGGWIVSCMLLFSMLLSSNGAKAAPCYDRDWWNKSSYSFYPKVGWNGPFSLAKPYIDFTFIYQEYTGGILCNSYFQTSAWLDFCKTETGNEYYQGCIAAGKYGNTKPAWSLGKYGAHIYTYECWEWDSKTNENGDCQLANARTYPHNTTFWVGQQFWLRLNGDWEDKGTGCPDPARADKRFSCGVVPSFYNGTTEIERISPTKILVTHKTQDLITDCPNCGKRKVALSFSYYYDYDDKRYEDWNKIGVNAGPQGEGYKGETTVTTEIDIPDEYKDNTKSFEVVPTIFANLTHTADHNNFTQEFAERCNGEKKIKMPGVQNPQSISYIINDDTEYKRKVTLNWLNYTKDRNCNGSYAIFCEDIEAGKISLSGTVDGDKTTATVDLPEYDKKYRYYVVFYLENWSDLMKKWNKVSDFPVGLYVSTGEISKTPDPNLSDIRVEPSEKSMTISWSTRKLSYDTKLLSVSDFNVYRRIAKTDKSKEGEWSKIGTVEYKFNNNTWTYTDESSDLKSGCESYDYMVDLTLGGNRNFFIISNTFSLKGNSSILSFEANKGTDNDGISLVWNPSIAGGNIPDFGIYRCQVDETEYARISTVLGKDGLYQYKDLNVKPSQIYRYKITSEVGCGEGGSKTITDSKEDVGYYNKLGSISGNIRYAGNTAVKSARVDLVGRNNEAKLYYSARFNNNGVIKWNTSKDKYNKLFADKAFTLEFWVKPDSMKSTLFDLGGNLSLTSDKNAALSLNVNGKANAVKDTLTIGKYQHIAITCDGKGKYTLYRRIVEQDTMLKVITLNSDTLRAIEDSTILVLGGTKDKKNDFAGNLDEFRIWNTNRSALDITENFGHKLSGTEENLRLYWPFDEGARGYYFDMSLNNDISNGNHAEIDIFNAPTVSDVIPDENVFGMYTWTDKYGYYSIPSVPFGTYRIIPTKGVHEFSPNVLIVNIDQTAELRNNDFEDKSSFPVRGNIYYENTNIPVDSAYISVDGIICMDEDRQIIMTDENGAFEISVPIGDHYIKVEKSGHTFVNNGRYPAIGTVTFEESVSGLKLYDNTLVSIAGRVCGGYREGEKSIGFGLGVNNIGTHNVVLSIGGSESSYSLSSKYSNTDAKFVEIPAKDTVKVSANNDEYYIKNASAYRKKTQIVITPDPLTGEFFVLVPPLSYTANVEIPTDSYLNIDNFDGNVTVDLRNPSMTTKDSAVFVKEGDTASVSHIIEFNKSLIFQANVQPTLEVLDTKHKDDELYGEYSYTFKNDLFEKEVKLIDNGEYAIGKTDSTPGLPVFEMGTKYKFEVNAYEAYTNYNTGKVDKVPYKGDLTVNNSMSSEHSVCFEAGVDSAGRKYDIGDVIEVKGNTVSFNEKGSLIYTWNCGFPNIVEPFTRKMTMSVGKTKKEIDAYIFGSMPTGNNFITAGTDNVLMILRDPAGSGSSCSWEKGSSITKEVTNNISFNTEASVHFNVGLGTSLTHGEGVGAFVINNLETKNNILTGTDLSCEWTKASTYTTTVTCTEAVSTSGDFDYVGAEGDVFIGISTNIVYGNARRISLKYDANADSFYVDRDEVISRSSQFSTAFNYTQNYIKGSLLPNILKNRNSMITKVSEDDYAGYKIIDSTGFVHSDAVDKVVYVSKIDEDDPHFGKFGYYKVLLPVKILEDTLNARKARGEGNKNVIVCDSVNWYNSQYYLWTNTLAKNEWAKVTAINDPKKYLDKNYSFDAGATIENSVETCDGTSIDTTRTGQEVVFVGWQSGVEMNGTGVIVETNVQETFTQGDEYKTETSNCTKFTYTLADEGDDDALTVDIFKAPDGYGPIFYTRAGQTSCPYEGRVVAEFYEPEKQHVISQATDQIEVPEINERTLTQEFVPVGECAYFDLTLQNLSQKTEEDINYILYCDPVANKSMPEVNLGGISIIGLNMAQKILIPNLQSVSTTIEVCQRDKSVSDFENIAVILSSECQNDPTGVHDVISDTCFLTVKFVKTCTPSSLVFEKTMNINTTDKLAYEISGYNVNYDGFEGIQLKYRQKGSDSWTMLDYFKKDTIKGSSFYGIFDMHGITYPDGEYELKSVSVCKGGVTRDSEIYPLSKDLKQPLAIEIQPANGILAPGDEISITFNEDIRNDAIVDNTNLSVKGTLNGSKINHSTAINLTGSSENVISTEARIDLSNRSFAGDFWINYTSAGTIIEHGSSDKKFAMSVASDSTLTVTIGKETYKSEKKMPAGKWNFVSFVYDNDKKTFSAQSANDATTVQLMLNKPVGSYDGNGILRVGTNGFVGQMHQFSLWGKARTLQESQNEKSVSKVPSSNGLIGYWKMEEGHGSAIKDYARSRNMVMSSPSWYSSDKNFAASLGDTSHIDINISRCPTNENEDYMIEMWFRGKAQSASTLFNFGDSLLSLGFNSNGEMVVNTNNNTTVITSKKYLDETWHHVAMNVRRNGFAAFYVDGEIVKQIAESNIPAVDAGTIILGATKNGEKYSNYFTGDIDEVRYWKATLTANAVKENMYQRLNAKSTKGLVAYCPFEKSSYDEYSQKVFDFSLDNMCDTIAANANKVSKSETTPSLKAVQDTSSIEFYTISDERKIVIKLKENDKDEKNPLAARLEGNTILFSVSGIKDVHNNECETINWTAYINQATLLWSDDERNLTVEAGDEKSFTATITNNGSKEEDWILSELPSWLTADVTNGTLKPLTSKTITFTVSSAAAIGRYEETIYLSGSQKIEQPLVVSLKVTGEVPDWKVNPADYESTMTLIAELKIDGTVSRDEEDLVAAFIGDECLGVVNPVYRERYDAYFVDMTIYGNSVHDKKSISFKAFDASTGKIYPVVTPSQTVTYKSDNLYGGYSDPITLTASDLIEQHINLEKGWNWVSLYSNPVNKTVESVLNDALNETTIKGQDQFNSKSNDEWGKGLGNVNIGNMYMIKSPASTVLSVQGDEVIAKENPLTIAKGWNWIGVNASYEMTVSAAFADLSPVNGDMVKGSKTFAIFDGYEWVGSLKSLTPGVGYKYNNKSGIAKAFNYPNKNAALRAGEGEEEGQASYFEPSDYHLFSSNMSIIAKVMSSKGVVTDAEVGAFIGKECRGANVAMSDDLVYLMVHGDSDESDTLKFKVYTGGKVYDIIKTAEYTADAMLGTLDDPYIINIDDTAVELIGSDALSVYPNPADNFISIDGIDAGSVVEIVNALGETMLYEEYNGKNVNVTSLQSGVYMVKIDGLSVGRFIKK